MNARKGKQYDKPLDKLTAYKLEVKRVVKSFDKYDKNLVTEILEQIELIK